MSKRARLIIFILVLVTCGVFLYPTYQWYFGLSRDEVDRSTMSREQIREYAYVKAGQNLEKLQEIMATNPEAPIPEEFYFLTKAAKKNYKLAERELPPSWTVRATLSGFLNRKEAFAAIEGHYRDELLDLKNRGGKILQLGLDLSGGMSILLQADIDSLEERLGHFPTREDETQAIVRAMEILNNRIDKFGVSEPQIRRQGDDQILVEIPGAADPDRVDAFLRGKGQLNFHIVDNDATATWNDYKTSNPTAFADADGRPMDADVLPLGRIVRGIYTKDSYGVDAYQGDVVIHEEPGLDGTHIVDAQVGNDAITGRPVINFTLDSEGGDIFFPLTSANVDKTLAIVLDSKVKAQALIRQAIRTGVRMTGFEREEANNLALTLRTGALPVDLKVNNQQSIGASLGEDSIRQGLRAITIGFAAVIIFMFLYYAGAGLVADLALVLNLFLIVGILSAFNLTLTLTSIAGLILTVGMAVDANVIIFERIKEEYRLGKSPEASIKAGFQKAFWTIMDANITTFIAAIFLSQVATGPVQGFAYTLAVGIVCSIFTALFVSRLLFDFSVETLKVKTLSIAWRKR